MNLNITARAVLAAADLTHRRPFLASARDHRHTQTKALRQILGANADTEFGREHGFGHFTSRDAYRAEVPVQTYDSLGGAIRRQANTGDATLTTERPVYYARTSGTTGSARDFPVTSAGATAQRVAQRILAATLRRGSEFFNGRIAALGGQHVEGHLPSGQPYGSASGLTAATAPRFARRKFVVPEQAFGISDPTVKYHAYALAMLASEDLTGIITANPSTLLSLFGHIHKLGEVILRDLADGSFTIDGSAGATGARQFMPNARPDRAICLERALARGLTFERIWPRLDTLATWSGGNCRVALDQILPMLPLRMRVAEIGYRSSEFIGSINVDATANLCLPDISHTVFEFVEEDRWECDDNEFLWLDEIEEGQRYYVFATTQSGLYRYHINDVVEVTGFVGTCPTLGFVRKGQGATSITGEKLYETQVMEAARTAARATGLEPGFFIAVADAQAAAYRLFHETSASLPIEHAAEIANAFDAALCAGNLEYAAKRSSGRLYAAEVVFVRPGTGEAIKAQAIAAGQREAQIKTPSLVDANCWQFDFSPYRWNKRA